MKYKTFVIFSYIFQTWETTSNTKDLQCKKFLNLDVYVCAQKLLAQPKRDSKTNTDVWSDFGESVRLKIFHHLFISLLSQNDQAFYFIFFFGGLLGQTENFHPYLICVYVCVCKYV